MRTNTLSNRTKIEQGFTNHVVLLLDASSSMTTNRNDKALIQVVDGLVASLAEESKVMDQETRVSIYSFADFVECLVHDKDVLRLPSIREHYRADGMTALMDAVAKGLDDLEKQPELYTDHSFLLYAITDGGENASRNVSATTLAGRLKKLPDNWTVAALVPNVQGKAAAQRMGFAPGNIQVWDANSKDGIKEVGRTVAAATTSYMTNRAAGVRSTTTLFSTGTQNVNTQTVKANLKPLDGSQYQAFPIAQCPAKTEIKAYVEGVLGIQYVAGEWFYQLSKSEKIQPHKRLMVMDRRTKKIYAGSEVRALIGLPDAEVRVKPDFNDQYWIFVQSTSVNRHLVEWTQLVRVVR